MIILQGIIFSAKKESDIRSITTDFGSMGMQKQEFHMPVGQIDIPDRSFGIPDVKFERLMDVSMLL
ncbi:hypothetical protein [Labilibaculum euxinus]